MHAHCNRAVQFFGWLDHAVFLRSNHVSSVNFFDDPSLIFAVSISILDGYICVCVYMYIYTYYIYR